MYIVVKRQLHRTQMLYDLFEVNRTLLNFQKSIKAFFFHLVFCIIKKELVA